MSEFERFDTVSDLLADEPYGDIAESHPAIVDELATTLTMRGVGQFLAARNRYLDGQTPREALQEEGGAEKVAAAVRAFVEGSYL